MTTDKLHWFKTAVQWQGSVAPTVVPRALLFGAFGLLISLIYQFKLITSWDIWDSITTNVLFNLVLGLLLVFRTNTAYDRYWEGRKCWGVLVINVRNLARQMRVAIAEPEPIDGEKKASALRLLVAFAVATKLRLRQEPVNPELEVLLTPAQFTKLQEVKSPPLQIALWIGDYLQQQYAQNSLSSDQLVAMNNLLNQMIEALTGCERILKTPMPVAYRIYLKRLLLIYGIFLPLQIVENLGLFTGFIVIIITYILLGIEQIGNEIEDPFGHDPNDLPLDDICKTILENIEDLIPIAESSTSSASQLEAVEIQS